MTVDLAQVALSPKPEGIFPNASIPGMVDRVAFGCALGPGLVEIGVPATLAGETSLPSGTSPATDRHTRPGTPDSRHSRPQRRAQGGSARSKILGRE